MSLMFVSSWDCFPTAVHMPRLKRVHQEQLKKVLVEHSDGTELVDPCPRHETTLSICFDTWFDLLELDPVQRRPKLICRQALIQLILATNRKPFSWWLANQPILFHKLCSWSNPHQDTKCILFQDFWGRPCHVRCQSSSSEVIHLAIFSWHDHALDTRYGYSWIPHDISYISFILQLETIYQKYYNWYLLLFTSVGTPSISCHSIGASLDLSGLIMPSQRKPARSSNQLQCQCQR